jgi:hypothetical protein
MFSRLRRTLRWMSDAWGHFGSLRDALQALGLWKFVIPPLAGAVGTLWAVLDQAPPLAMAIAGLAFGCLSLAVATFAVQFVRGWRATALTVPSAGPGAREVGLTVGEDRRSPLAIEFTAIGWPPDLKNPYFGAGFYTEPPEGDAGRVRRKPRSVYIGQVHFSVRNRGESTVYDVAAHVLMFGDLDEPAYPVRWAIARTIPHGRPEPGLTADIAPGDAASFILFAYGLTRGDPRYAQYAQHARETPEAAELFEAALGGEVHIGGIGRGKRFTMDRKVRLGVGIHARDTPPVYGWFEVEVGQAGEGPRVSFRAAASLG